MNLFKATRGGALSVPKAAPAAAAPDKRACEAEVPSASTNQKALCSDVVRSLQERVLMLESLVFAPGNVDPSCKVSLYSEESSLSRRVATVQGKVRALEEYPSKFGPLFGKLAKIQPIFDRIVEHQQRTLSDSTVGGGGGSSSGRSSPQPRVNFKLSSSTSSSESTTTTTTTATTTITTTMTTTTTTSASPVSTPSTPSPRISSVTVPYFGSRDTALNPPLPIKESAVMGVNAEQLAQSIAMLQKLETLQTYVQFAYLTEAPKLLGDAKAVCARRQQQYLEVMEVTQKVNQLVASYADLIEACSKKLLLWDLQLKILARSLQQAQRERL